MSVGVGSIHLGWDVLAIAAGGGDIPVEPVPVDGEIAPPAYLLADPEGRILTGRADRDRADVGVAVRDVRDILGYSDISIAGASWPVDLVFRARLHNPLSVVRGHLGREPQAVAVPYPDDWPEERVELLYDRFAQLGVGVETVPESVALAGYMRGAGLVHEDAPGATVVYSDSRTLLVVAAQSDPDQPTESIDVPLDLEAFGDAARADGVVWSVLAAAKSIGSDAGTVLLAGNIVYNDFIRMAFLNHLGNRMQIAQHPLHAVALGAAYLVSEDPGEEDDAEHPDNPERPHEVAEPAAEPTRPAPPQTDSRPKGWPWRRGLTFALPAVILLVGALLAGRWLAGPTPLSDDDARTATASVLPADDAFAGMSVDGKDRGVTTEKAEMTSMACGSVPLTAVEADGARASATRVFAVPVNRAGPVAAMSTTAIERSEPGDAIAVRVMTFDDGTAEPALVDVLRRVQECPNRAADDIRYVVPVPTSGDDPGPPVQSGGAQSSGSPSIDVHGQDLLAWRGLQSTTASTVGRIGQVTCLLSRVDDRLLRSCGTSLDSRRADTLAQSGLDAMRHRLDG